jgi:hypothetical protein
VIVDHTHEHPGGDFWTRPHPEPVVLDIGGDVGALILYTRPELHGHEIEVSRTGQRRRVHSAVLQRAIAGRAVFAAVYPELEIGSYTLWSDLTTPAGEVTIPGGCVAVVDWR